MYTNTPVRGAARALELFEAFAGLGRPATLSELARLIAVPVSSCHGLVRTLEARGYLYSLGARRGLYPTRRLLDVAEACVRHDPLLGLARPVLEALRDTSRETVILGKRQGGQVVYLEVIEGPQTVRYAASPGDTKPLHSSAIGKALLAGDGGPALDAALEGLALPRVTASTLTDVAALREDLEAGLRRGHFVTRGENVADVMAIAVAVPMGEERLAVAVAGPLQRMERNVDPCAAALAGCRDALASRLA